MLGIRRRFRSDAVLTCSRKAVGDDRDRSRSNSPIVSSVSYRSIRQVDRAREAYIIVGQEAVAGRSFVRRLVKVRGFSKGRMCFKETEKGTRVEVHLVRKRKTERKRKTTLRDEEWTSSSV